LFVLDKWPLNLRRSYLLHVFDEICCLVFFFFNVLLSLAGFVCPANLTFPVVCPRSSFCPANATSPTVCPSATPYAFVGSSSLAACSVFPVVTTLAGGNGGTTPGFTNGQGTLATFYYPATLAIDASGTAYVVEFDNSLIRTINSTGEVRTLAGGNGGKTRGLANGKGTLAMFWNPQGVAVDASGTAYVADTGNNLIRAINISTGAVRTLAGGNGGTTPGSANGQGTLAKLKIPTA
jgi:hypothetical protein